MHLLTGKTNCEEVKVKLMPKGRKNVASQDSWRDFSPALGRKLLTNHTHNFPKEGYETKSLQRIAIKNLKD